MVAARRRAPMAGARWGLVDQAVSTGTNFLLTLGVVRSTSLADFGAFALVYALYILVLGALRASGGNVYTVRFGHDGDLLTRAAGPFLGYAAGLGATLGAVAALVALALNGPVQPMLLTLAAVLPPLLVQDALRTLQFARGTPARAAENDGVWALLLLALLAVLLLQGETRAWVFLAAWGSAGAVAAGVGLLRAGVRPELHLPHHWWLAHHALATPQLKAHLLLHLPPQLVYLLMPLVAGIDELGEVRAAYVVFGPLGVVFSGLSMAALPAAVRAASGGAVLPLARRLSVVLGVVAVGWGVLVVAVPAPVGELLLGPSWTQTTAARAFLALSAVAEGVFVGAWIALSARALPGRLVRVQALTGPVQLVAGVGLAWYAGAVGAAAAFALANALTAVLAWRQARGADQCSPSTLARGGADG